MVILSRKFLGEKFGSGSVLNGLIELDLRGMDIDSIARDAFTDVPNLVYLWLNDNRLAALEPHTFAHVPYLSRLALHNNQLERIEPHTFASLAQLTRLSLAHNRLARLEPKSLVGLGSLEFLSLNDNRLDEIGPSVFADGLDRDNILVVSMYGNTSAFKSFVKGSGVIGEHHLNASLYKSTESLRETTTAVAPTQWQRDVMNATSVNDFDEFLAQFLGRNSFQSL